jgi:uncharacterized membrane-anchored protein
MGYLPSGIFFFAVILLPALAWWRFGLNSITAFWMAYVVTRPLGASFADYISKSSSLTGIGFGNGPTAVVFALVTFVLVSYLAIARPDIQQVVGPVAEDGPSRSPTPDHLVGTSELDA